MPNTKDVTVEEKLRALYDLQLIDSRIDEIRSIRGELPLEIEDLEDEIVGLNKRLSNLNEDIEHFNSEISGKKITIEEAKELIKKYGEQQKNVRNNREFNSIAKEIEYQELEIELAEKRIREFKAKIEQKIKDGNLDPAIGEVLWKVAEDSANYSFNKSHSISYAYLAAITVYLKFNHPKEFFLSLLKMARFEPNSHEEIAKISQELSFFNIKLLPPDLNLSDFDFKIDGDNIRYGLNSIKGVSGKVIESLIDFRESKFENKYDVFIAAKNCGVNIGTMSAFIQAGLLDSFVTTDRCRLVLEAQTFNILTDREKRNVLEVGERFNYDVLNTVHHFKKTESPADDGRLFFTERRFNTFKKKYMPYKEIYQQNGSHIKYANWFFEEKLLGYSYSYNIRQIFSSGDLPSFHTSEDIKRSPERRQIKFVGTVTDIIKRTSRNGNKYARIEMNDDVGMVCGLFLDSDRNERLTDYLSSGKKLPKKGDIVIITGSVGQDVVFVDSVNTIKEKIYMKLSELK